MNDHWPFDWSPPARATHPGPEAGRRAAVALGPVVAQAARSAADALATLAPALQGTLGALSALARTVRPEEDRRG